MAFKVRPFSQDLSEKAIMTQLDKSVESVVEWARTTLFFALEAQAAEEGIPLSEERSFQNWRAMEPIMSEIWTMAADDYDAFFKALPAAEVPRYNPQHEFAR